MSDQATVHQATDSGPTVGQSLDERTHYAHVRYAASDEPGVIWYDPRDGHEYLTTGADTSLDALDNGDEVVTSVRLYPKRGRCEIADLSDEWAMEVAVARVECFEPLKLDADPEPHVVNAVRTDTFENAAAARKAAAEAVPLYADAEYRDAVAYRTDN